MSDYDSPWKDALEQFFPAFMAFFFPEIFAAIDWSRDYEALDKEFQQIAREAAVGRRYADKLFKVWLRNGQETWILIHVEVQSQRDEEFAERMFVYHYRLYDRFQRPVVSLAVLGDESPGWRPNQYHYSQFGCTMTFEFPVVKLLDYGVDLAALEASTNPFAPFVLAHLKTMETRHDAAGRQVWKLRVIKGLYERGYARQHIQQLFRLIDWMMDLPTDLENQFHQELARFEEEKQMPYVTSIERFAEARGRAEALLQVLAIRFPPEVPEDLAAKIRTTRDLNQLSQWLALSQRATTLEEFRSLASL